MEASASEIQNVTLCAVCNSGSSASSGALMDTGSGDVSLGGAG